MLFSFGVSSNAQFVQQGGKLTGTGATESATRPGESVGVSSDGTTAIVGGARGVWIFTQSGGVWTQQAVLTAGSGLAVSISGDGNTALVGRSTENTVLVFTRTAGTWTQQATLAPSNAIGNAQFGKSVSISDDGNTALIGGNYDNAEQGAAWVFTRSAGTWSQNAKLVGTGNSGAASQGISVCIAKNGQTAVVGGYFDNNGAGAAWFYRLVSGVWTQQAKMVGTGAVGQAYQGYSVSLESRGEMAIIGGPLDNSGAGAAWLFSSNALGSMSQVNSKVSTTGTFQYLGWSVAFDGMDPVAGCRTEGNNVGSVYAFTRNGSGWTPTKLVTTGSVGEPAIGTSVSVSTTMPRILFTGGPYDNGGNGAVWVFSGSGTTWAQQGSKLIVTGVPGQPNQGNSVSVSSDGNTAVTGGPADNLNFNIQGSTGTEGAVWVFARTAGNWMQQGTKLVATGGINQPNLGYSVAVSGDGNTIISGGPDDNYSKGAAWVFARSGGSWIQQAKLVGTVAANVQSYQGYSVAIAADGNTAIVGGPGSGAGGAAWVFTRNGTTWTEQAKLVGTGGTLNTQGLSVSLSADGNTALIGCPEDGLYNGAAWVFKRTGGSWAQVTKLVGTGNVGSAGQGWSVSLSGDGNTAMVGGYVDNGEQGAVWVFNQSGGTWTQQGSKLVGTGSSGNARQGTSVSLSADGNKAIVGGPEDAGGTGASWVFTRTGGVWTQQGNKLVGTGGSAAKQGRSVSLSGEGSTFIHGGPYDNANFGAAWVFYNDPCAGISNNRIYVNAAATGANNGKTWANAFTDLQAALAATATCPITEIWVAAGTYKPTGGTNRSASFVMKNNLAIYGGFAGTETLLSQRNWNTNVTILSGDIGAANVNTDNSYNVVLNYDNGLNNTAILDGFTITGGYANGPAFNEVSGAGMHNRASSPAVINCIFSNHTASGGAGMYNSNGAAPLINYCSFTGCTATAGSGGGIGNASSSPVIGWCRFTGNSANSGGAIGNSSSSPAVSNSLFYNNFAFNGAAIFNISAGNPVVTNCSFAGNNSGGGVVNNSFGPNTTLSNSIIWGNQAGTPSIVNNSASIAVNYCNIEGGYAGTGNINANPLFADAANGNLRLLNGSPAIDAGLDAYNSATTDLAGNPRLVDYIAGGNLVDMGAYESAPFCTPPVVTYPQVTQPTCLLPTGRIIVRATGTESMQYSINNGATYKNTASFTGLAPGSYNIVVRYISTPSCSTVLAANPIIINPVPALLAPTAISGPVGVCRNAIGQVFSVTPVEGAVSYVWTLPFGATGSSTTNSISVNFSSTYVTGNICVRAVNSCGQSPQFCREIKYYGAKPVTPDPITGPMIGLCTNQTYSVPAVLNTNNYIWTAPASTTIVSGQGTPQIVLSFGSGFVSGTLSVAAANCKGTSNARTLLLSRNPAMPASISGPVSAVCAGSTQAYSCPLVTGATIYTWTVPAGAVINSGQGTNALSVTFPAGFVSGTVKVASGTSCSSGTAKSISITSTPSFPAPIAGPVSVCPSATGLQYSTTAVAGVTYNWTVPNGATITAGQGTAAITVSWGLVAGQVKVAASNVCGTSATRSLSVSLLSCAPAVVTMAKAEEVGGEGLKVSLWPNPAKDVLMVTLDEFVPNQKMELTLMQADGKVQTAQSLIPMVKGQQVRLDVSRAAAGYYILLVKQPGLVINRQVVIIR